MSGPNFNITDRVPATSNPAREFDIYTTADFGVAEPAPDGNMRVPLVPGGMYKLHAQVALPLFLVPEVVTPGVFEFIIFTSQNSSFNGMTVDITTAPIFWGRDIGAINFTFTSIQDITNGFAGGSVKLFDLVGGNGNQSVLSMGPFAIVNMKEVGNLVDCGIFYGELSQTFGNRSGFVCRITPEGAAGGQSNNLSGIRFLGNPGAADTRRPEITFIGDVPETVMAASLVSLGKIGNAFIQLDSGSPEGNFAITGNGYKSAASGEFFRPTEVETITAMADAKIDITDIIDSLAAPGVDSTVEFDGSVQDFVRGQEILISGAAQSNYNALHTIVRVNPDQKSFDIKIVSVTPSAATLEQTFFGVPAGVKFARDETITITNTSASYLGTFKALAVTDVAFTLPVPFDTDEATGTATSTGKDETFPGVVCLGNGFQEDSVRKGGVGPRHFDIFRIEDLPDKITAPDGIERVPLVGSAKYLIHETFEWPRCFVPEQTIFDRFEPIDFLGARTEVRIEFDGASGIHVGGDADTPMFWGRDIGSLRFDSVGLHDSGNSDAGHVSTAFDLVGGSGFSLLGMSFLPAEQWKRIGKLVDIALEFRPHAISDNQEGYVVRHNAAFASNLAHSIEGTRFTQPNDKGTTAPMLVFQGSPVSTVMGISSIDQQIGDSFISIDSGSASKQYVITGMGFEAVVGGSFFRPDISETITSWAENEEVILSIAAAPSPRNLTHTLFRFANIQPFTRGQLVLVSGCTQGTLNVMHQITLVDDDQKGFEVQVANTSTAGSPILERTTVTVDAATHGLVEGETVTTSGTGNATYNVTREVLSISANRKSFDLPIAFIDTQTGTVGSVCKTERSVGVGVVNCGAQKNSKAIGGVSLNANTTNNTTIALTDIWQTVNLTGSGPLSNEERFTLVDAANGISTYDDFTDFNGFVNAAVTAKKTGGGSPEEYRFHVTKNSIIPAPATTPYAPIEIPAEIDTAVINTPLQMNAVKQLEVTMVSLGGTGTNFTSVGHGLIFGNYVVNSGFDNPAYNGTFIVSAVSSDIYELDAVTFTADDTGQALGKETFQLLIRSVSNTAQIIISDMVMTATE